VLPADGQSLQAKLGAALDSLARGNRHGAVGPLTAFTNQVRAFISTGTLMPAQGQPLIDMVDAVIQTLHASRGGR